VLANQMYRPAKGTDHLQVFDLNHRADDRQQGQGRQAWQNEKYHSDDHRNRDQNVRHDEPLPRQGPHNVGEGLPLPAVLRSADQAADKS